MAQNLISQTMTDVQRDAMLADLEAFDTKWGAYKVNLTPEQIAKLAKIKPSDIGALETALTFAQQNPGAISGDMDIAGLAQDVALARQAIIVNAAAQQKADLTHTTIIAALSDGRVTADQIYRVEKAKGKNPQNATFLEEYGQRYARGPQSPPPPAPNP